MVLPCTFSDERALQVGIIALQADERLEPDLRRMMPAHVDYFVTRVPSGTSVSRESLRAMERRITDAAAILPRAARLSAVAYGCTSASAEIGVAQIAQLVQAGVTTPSVTEPLSALIAACTALRVRRLALISPYVAEVSDRLREEMTRSGLDVTAFASFDVAEEARVVRIDPASVLSAATEIGQGGACDAVFLSCTNLNTLDTIEEAERRLGKPVLSSNQVLIWHLGQLAGFSDQINGVGRLFET